MLGKSRYQFITLEGLISYSTMIQKMEEKLESIIAGNSQCVIYLLEHEDVYTAGSSYKVGNDLYPSLQGRSIDFGNLKEYNKKMDSQIGVDSPPCNDKENQYFKYLTINSIPLIYTSRGGKITYHGKGQRIIYPIINLTTLSLKNDIGFYVRSLEKWIINSLNELGIKSYTIKDKVGIWVNVAGVEAKIASIGIKVKKWVAYHGISINISSDLSKFDDIIACGIKNIKHTSLAKLGVNVSLEEFDNVLKQQFNNTGF